MNVGGLRVRNGCSFVRSELEPREQQREDQQTRDRDRAKQRSNAVTGITHVMALFANTNRYYSYFCIRRGDLKE